ncbi:potassium channel family protein [Flavobacterium amniphilum]|uniref:potassium channel family protein n=1 Tax=Flavobacterium amniphilum TaxID=1834035 RepID=UPI00202A1EE2|nr:potassium channel family protein [Flavobacterium amniphilum]MCL9804482.1 potassium channel family protein [Flavobacterium amniphilum]
MPKSQSQTQEEKLTPFNIVILVLSIYILGSFFADAIFTLPAETSRLLNFIDNAVCVIFLIDFIIHFRKAPNKLRFMYWGWIDLISIIPVIDYVRVGRILRLIRLLRILKAFRSTKNIVSHVFKNKAQSTFTSVSIIAIMLIIFSSIAILQVERDSQSNIKTAEDAIWWAYVTITTVGYGDKYPVTTEGRLIAIILMTGGVGLFGTFTAYASSWFLVESNKNDNNKID